MSNLEQILYNRNFENTSNQEFGNYVLIKCSQNYSGGVNIHSNIGSAYKHNDERDSAKQVCTHLILVKLTADRDD